MPIVDVDAAALAVLSASEIPVRSADTASKAAGDAFKYDIVVSVPPGKAWAGACAVGGKYVASIGFVTV
jgi:hypothetical protein